VVLPWCGLWLLAIGTYTNWVYFGAGLKQLVEVSKMQLQVKRLKVPLLKESFHCLVGCFALVVFTQIMASFYVADWCQGGF
jgi:hypothetical protein